MLKQEAFKPMYTYYIHIKKENSSSELEDFKEKLEIIIEDFVLWIEGTFLVCVNFFQTKSGINQEQ